MQEGVPCADRTSWVTCSVSLVSARRARRAAATATDKASDGRFPSSRSSPRELLSISTWVGGSGNNWSTAANWQGDQVPTAGAALVFSGTNTTSNNDLTGFTAQSIEFSSNNFTLGGNSLTLSSGVTVDHGVTGETISMPVALGGPATVTLPVSGTSTLTMSGVISGSNSLTDTGSGTLTLTGANTYTGGTTIGGPGTLAFGRAALARHGAITFTDGILQWLPGNTQDVSGRFAPVASGDVAGFDTGTNSSVTLASPISGAGAFDKYAGTGTLILTAANTQTGGSEVDQGTLQMGNAGAIGNGQEVYVESPGILDLNGYSPTVGGLWGNGTITTSAGTSALTVTTDPYCGNSEFDGVIQNGAGTVSLTKIGTCTFTMTGQNTYTGGTTINAGTLDLSGGNNRLSTSGGITVAGGTLDLGGYSQTTSGVVSFQGGTVQDGTINKSGSRL